MSQAQLLKRIDELGTLREKMRELKEKEKALVDLIEPEIKVGEDLATNRFKAGVILRTERVISQDIARTLMGQKKFLSIAKVNMTDLKKVLGAEDIDKATTDTKETRVLRIDPI